MNYASEFTVELTTALGPTASALLAVSVAVVLGLLLGQVQIRGVRLGVSGVLFSSLAMAEIGVNFDHVALLFIRDFSMVLFVYAIGLQIGPSFLASFRAEGLRLNLLSAAALVLGAIFAAIVTRIFPVPRDAAVGVFSGAVIATPALAGGQEVIRQILVSQPVRESAALSSASLAYAVTYPFGMVESYVLIAMLRRFFHIRMDEERAALNARESARRQASINADFEITKGLYSGRPLRDLPRALRRGVVLSRLYRSGALSVPRSSTILQQGDVFRAFGAPDDVHRVVSALGRPSTLDLSQVAGDFRRVDLVVTRPGALRRSLHDLGLPGRIGVMIAQVSRAGVELIPHCNLMLKFGDHVTVVGHEKGIQIAAQELGNEPAALNRPFLFPVFIGLALGVLVGAIPLRIPGLPVPLQTGLAGGSFVVAIALSQLGNVGSIIWYMPPAANQMVRDLGLCFFFACIGFQSGGGLLARASHAGLGLILAGACVTVVPTFLVACVARRMFRMNFLTLSGWVAGTMTNTPALQFAIDVTQSDAPSLAYAAVTPLSEVLPIICAEVLALSLR